MNENTLTSAVTTKARQPAQKWVRFFDLKHGEIFYIGRHTAKKIGLCRYGMLTIPGLHPRLWPWTKVRSQRPAKKSTSEVNSKT